MPSVSWQLVILLGGLIVLSFTSAVALWAAGALNRDPECEECGSTEIDLGTDEHGDWWWECQNCGYCWAAATHEDDGQTEQYR